MTKAANFIQNLDRLNSFRLHTGNINAYTELKLKRFKNSAEELSACLQLQLQSTPLCNEFRDDETLLLCDNAHIENYEREDLKITMKVFLSSWDPKEVRESVKCLREQLNTEDIQLLIIATPEYDIVEGESDEEETKRWLNLMTPVWREAEALVDCGEVVSIGLNDVNVRQLLAVCNMAETKPAVDHIRLDGCCIVPPELQEFAKEHDIQLLTHNDPQPFPVDSVFDAFCDIKRTLPCCCSKFRTTWAARYTVWLRRRSVMAAKGYLVQFKKRGTSQD